MRDTTKTEVVEDVRDEILAHLEKIERPLSWLSDKTKIPYATLYSCFKQRLFRVSKNNMEAINEVLDTNFVYVAPATTEPEEHK